jgi:hypothetical protein
LYTPDWETLVDALNRVVAATHVSKLQAQTAICHAIADKKIKIRVVVDPSHITDGGRTFGGGNVGVPPRLDPADFDWARSRPIKPWSIGPMPGQHYYWNGGNRPISLIELSTADVTSVFSGETRPNPSDEYPANLRSAGRKPRKLERVKEAMKRDIQAGKHTATTLRDMLEKNLAAEYNVSRDTVRKARDQVLSEINSRQ